MHCWFESHCGWVNFSTSPVWFTLSSIHLSTLHQHLHIILYIQVPSLFAVLKMAGLGTVIGKKMADIFTEDEARGRKRLARCVSHH